MVLILFSALRSILLLISVFMTNAEIDSAVAKATLKYQLQLVVWH